LAGVTDLANAASRRVSTMISRRNSREPEPIADPEQMGFTDADDKKKRQNWYKMGMYTVIVAILVILGVAYFTGLLEDDEDNGSFGEKAPTFDRVMSPLNQPIKHYEYSDEVWADNDTKMKKYKEEGGFHKFYIPRGSPLIWSCDLCKKRGMVEGEPAFGSFKYNVGCCGDCYCECTKLKFEPITKEGGDDEWKIRRPLLDVYKERRARRAEL